MILIESKRLVIITPPKTASTALFYALCCGWGGLLVVERSKTGNVDHHNTELPGEATGWRVALTVRNPYDRLVGLYQHYCRWQSRNGWAAPSWTEWASRVIVGEYDPLYHLTQSQFYSNNPDVVIRCESLAADLGAQGINVPIPRRNESYRLPWPDYYAMLSADVRQAVGEWGRETCQRFGYSLLQPAG